jgi:ribosomal protein S7
MIKKNLKYTTTKVVDKYTTNKVIDKLTINKDLNQLKTESKIKCHGFQETLVGCITKKGKKMCARNIVTKALNDVCFRTNRSYLDILKVVIQKLSIPLETKTIKMRKRISIVPVPVNKNRQNFLIVNTLLSSAKEDRTKRPIFQKLADEIYSLLTSNSSNSITKRNLVVKKAILNKSNIHYRW